jgi:hypothetical protein
LVFFLIEVTKETLEIWRAYFKGVKFENPWAFKAQRRN